MKRLYAFGTAFTAIAIACLLVNQYVIAQSERIAGHDASRSDLRLAEALLQRFDIDHDNRLSFAEVHAISQSLCQNDLDGNGYLDRNELHQPSQTDHRQQETSMPRSSSQRKPSRVSEDTQANSKVEKASVLFHEGFETDPRDGGRPVVLIAAALGVKEQVFRDAFSGVRPARGGVPSRSRVRENKQVLLDALEKYGVSNDRLDEVSDYYRYCPQDGELWTHRPARAHAVVLDDKVVELQLQDAGAGYSSVPRIEVVGYPEAKVTATLEYGTDLRSNGRIAKLTIKK